MKNPGFHETDGRRLRSQASRERIIDAVVALIDEGHTNLNAEFVADRAGVGLRSVFRHFGDMASLYTAVLDRIGKRYAHLARPYQATDWPGQLREALGRRLGVYEGGLAFSRAASLHRDGSPTMGMGPSVFNELLRSRLESVVPSALQADVMWFEQVDLWLSLDCYASLRQRRAMTHTDAAELMTHAVERLIAEKL
jgi:AcrR family transcriptional regulator